MHFQSLIFDLDGFDVEVDPDDSHMRLLEDILAEPSEDIGLVYSAIADDDQFDHVVVFVLAVIDFLIRLLFICRNVFKF